MRELYLENELIDILHFMKLMIKAIFEGLYLNK